MIHHPTNALVEREGKRKQPLMNILMKLMTRKKIMPQYSINDRWREININEFLICFVSGREANENEFLMNRTEKRCHVLTADHEDVTQQFARILRFQGCETWHEFLLWKQMNNFEVKHEQTWKWFGANSTQVVFTFVSAFITPERIFTLWAAELKNFLRNKLLKIFCYESFPGLNEIRKN